MACRGYGLQGILCFLAARQLHKLRLGEGAERPTLIEPVNDVTGAVQAPVKGGVAAKRNFEAVKRAALRKAPSPAARIPYCLKLAVSKTRASATKKPAGEGGFFTVRTVSDYSAGVSAGAATSPPSAGMVITLSAGRAGSPSVAGAVWI